MQFVGGLNDHRSKCWRHIRRVKYFERCINKWVWSLSDWQKLAKQTGVIYLNMHRYCNDSSVYVHAPRPLETVRMSQLLSVGGVVLSEEINDTGPFRHPLGLEFMVRVQGIGLGYAFRGMGVVV